MGPTILYVLQAKNKETKRQNKLIVHTCTFTGRVIALTIVSVIMDPTIELLTQSLQGHAKTRLIITLLAKLGVGCSKAPIRWLTHYVTPVIILPPIPENSVFVEPTRCSTYVQFARARILPGVARGISLSLCRAYSAYATTAMWAFYLMVKGIYYAYPQKVDTMVTIGKEYLHRHFKMFFFLLGASSYSEIMFEK